ncbi:DUF481 domain-containing protein [Thermodesulfovibrio yellowstonii]|uniref:DUF481 domain-containing protein n=1 Tax=Thermodesulfovibrio yellowstonii TaxID=28262 RepID=UPI0024B36037|nr:DUF481 domain-containing protein [Thermodesulfovibrio yellowstonii]MDI6864628.1 DUF481 domain-containing protein [Thermodesulfovibrio yellowstonii]
MKKLLMLLRSLFRRRQREHTCEELDPFFSISLLLTVFLFLSQVTHAAEAAEVYLFTQHADMKNSKASEYVDFKSSENLAGAGFATHVISKDKDKLDIKIGLGKSDTNIKISQSVKVLNKVYSVNKKLKYNTSMYLFSVSYSYNISKSFSVAAEFEQSKNALKRDTYILKISHEF